jgi:hypothetical protein
LDAKWLDILKASGWQTAAIAAACGVIYWLIGAATLPDPGAAIKVLIAAAGIICAALTIGAVIGATEKPLRRAMVDSLRNRRARKRIRDYIPHLTDDERAIFGYLVHKNQKTFTSAIDGGKAATLIAQGFIIQTVRRGQTVDLEHVPCVVPDLVWVEVVKLKDQLPKPQRGKPHPWRVSWMVR